MRREISTKCSILGKYCYPTQSAAEFELLSIYHRFHTPKQKHYYAKLPTGTYKCKCGQWHLTAMYANLTPQAARSFEDMLSKLDKKHAKILKKLTTPKKRRSKNETYRLPKQNKKTDEA